MNGKPALAERPSYMDFCDLVKLPGGDSDPRLDKSNVTGVAGIGIPALQRKQGAGALRNAVADSASVRQRQIKLLQQGGDLAGDVG